MLTSKVTRKGQTTLPREVRLRLEVSPGDRITYEAADNGFLIRRARPFDAGWHAALQETLAAEWNSPEDEEDFRGL